MYKWFKINFLLKTLSAEHMSTVFGSVKLICLFLLHPMLTEQGFSSLNQTEIQESSNNHKNS